MKKLLAVCLTILTLFTCTACQAYTLTDMLPKLIDAKTQLPEITAIHVVRLSDGATVSLTEAAALNEMMLHVDGIQCAREDGEPDDREKLYEIHFVTATDEVLLNVWGTEEFTMGAYTYLAVRGGMDLFYLNNLFTEALVQTEG